MRFKPFTTLLCLAGMCGTALAQEGSHLPRIATMLERGEQEVKIVCIGDSITGVYYHTGGRRAYPEMLEVALKRAYPKAKVKVINAGNSGDNMVRGLNRLESQVLNHKPQLVTIMFGMNDLTGFGTDTFKKNLTSMSDQCRAIGAEVLLCTQNSVLKGRSPQKLAAFTQAILDVGKAAKIPVADSYKVYEAIRAKEFKAWSLLMSDDIHPNMDGHKLFASVIAQTITGKQDSLRDVGPPVPAIPRTLGLLKDGKDIKVLAMPPYDKVIGLSLQAAGAKGKVEVTSWPTEGKSIADIQEEAKKLRALKLDLVIVAVPASAAAAEDEAFIRSFSWVLNWSLSFAYQQWDVVAIPPSTAQPKLAGKEAERDALIRRLIAAQDLSMVTRAADDESTLTDLLTRWVKEQVRQGAGQ